MNSAKKKRLDEKLVHFLAKDMRPTTLVEGEGFRKFMQEVDSQYVLPSRRKIVRDDLPNLQKKVQDSLKAELAKAESVALTSDLWSSVTNTPFIGLTAHFLDPELKLSSKLIGCVKFSERHTSTHIEAKIRSLLDEYEIKEKVLTCTTDNANNIVKATKDLGLVHIPCLAHKLNLCAMDCLDKFEGLVLVRKKILSLVTATKKSSVVKYEFEECQGRLKDCPPVALIRECKTRWNSTFLMLQRAVELREAITLFQASESGQEWSFSGEEWTTAKESIKLLQPLFQATVEMSTEKFVTASKVIPIVKSLLGWYAGEGRRLPQPSFSHDLCNSLLQSLYQRFQAVEDVKELSLATLCDPRYKKQGFRNGEKASRAVSWLKEILTSSSPARETEEGEGEAGEASSEASLWSSFDQEVNAKKSVSAAGRDAVQLEVTR